MQHGTTFESERVVFEDRWGWPGVGVGSGVAEVGAAVGAASRLGPFLRPFAFSVRHPTRPSPTRTPSTCCSFPTFTNPLFASHCFASRPSLAAWSSTFEAGRGGGGWWLGGWVVAGWLAAGEGWLDDEVLAGGWRPHHAGAVPQAARSAVLWGRGPHHTPRHHGRSIRTMCCCGVALRRHAVSMPLRRCAPLPMAQLLACRAAGLLVVGLAGHSLCRAPRRAPSTAANRRHATLSGSTHPSHPAPTCTPQSPSNPPAPPSHPRTPLTSKHCMLRHEGEYSLPTAVAAT